MKQKLISVIVPVYNVEKYLEKCIFSITQQTYNNLEIILVDDGSYDSSPQICDLWAAKDYRIQVFHIKNSGGGQARNWGLNHANGEYIAFVDSDDYISEYMFEYLEQQLKDGYDIAECDYLTVQKDNAVFDKFEAEDSFIECTAKDALSFNVKDQIFRQIIWNKLYKKEVIGEIRFPVGTQIDDEFWTYKVIGNAKKLIHSDKKLYAYRQQADSIMHKINAAKKIEALKAAVEKQEYIVKYFPELESESLVHLWMKCIYQGQIVLLENDKEEIQKEFKYIKDIIQKYPIKNKSKITLKQRIWIAAFGLKQKAVCRIRNYMKIGF